MTTTLSLSNYAERALADGDGAPPMIYPDYALWPLPAISPWHLLGVLYLAVIVAIVWLIWKANK